MDDIADRTRNLKKAQEDLNLNDQETSLYQRHLDNLWSDKGVTNADGSRSTLYQATEEHDNKYYNVPTVWDGKIETEPWIRPSDGKAFDIPNETAISNINKAGWDTFPSYNTPEEADTRYSSMHDYMEKDTGDWMSANGAWNDQ